jgi:hypothetical protein
MCGRQTRQACRATRREATLPGSTGQHAWRTGAQGHRGTGAQGHRGTGAQRQQALTLEDQCCTAAAGHSCQPSHTPATCQTATCQTARQVYMHRQHGLQRSRPPPAGALALPGRQLPPPTCTCSASCPSRASSRSTVPSITTKATSPGSPCANSCCPGARSSLSIRLMASSSCRGIGQEGWWWVSGGGSMVVGQRLLGCGLLRVHQLVQCVVRGSALWAVHWQRQ